MALTMRQLAADANQEYGAQLFSDRTLTAFGIQIRETGQEILAMNKLDRLWQERRQTKLFADCRFGFFNPGINCFYRCFQRTGMALAITHYAFPVPLVNVNRVNSSKTVFIGAKSFHVRVKPFARAEVVLSQGLTLPLREGMNHFELGIWQCFHFHLYRFFATRQVVLRPVAHAA